MTKFLIEIWPIGADHEPIPVGVWHFKDGETLDFWYNEHAETAGDKPRSEVWRHVFALQKLPFDNPDILFAYVGGEGQMVDRLGVFQTEEDWQEPEELIELAKSAEVITPENNEITSRSWWEQKSRNLA